MAVKFYKKLPREWLFINANKSSRKTHLKWMANDSVFGGALCDDNNFNALRGHELL
jgi:hypothetical protein